MFSILEESRQFDDGLSPLSTDVRRGGHCVCVWPLLFRAWCVYLDEFAITSSCNAHKVSFTTLQQCFEVNHRKAPLPFASHGTFCPVHMCTLIRSTDLFVDIQ